MVGGRCRRRAVRALRMLSDPLRADCTADLMILWWCGSGMLSAWRACSHACSRTVPRAPTANVRVDPFHPGRWRVSSSCSLRYFRAFARSTLSRSWRDLSYGRVNSRMWIPGVSQSMSMASGRCRLTAARVDGLPLSGGRPGGGATVPWGDCRTVGWLDPVPLGPGLGSF